MKGRKSILVVEDDEALRTVLVDALTGEGYSVRAVQNGKEGLEATAEKPDLIILDLLMPEMGGVEMLKTLRNRPGGAGARVLVLTNVLADTPKSVRDITETAPEQYLIKSDWAITDLLAKVGAVLESA